MEFKKNEARITVRIRVSKEKDIFVQFTIKKDRREENLYFCICQPYLVLTRVGGNGQQEDDFQQQHFSPLFWKNAQLPFCFMLARM
jgi:hypothetical protein